MMHSSDGKYGMRLDEAIGGMDDRHMVYKGDLRPGDTIVVRTFNSSYTIRMRELNCYDVSGGWFDRKGVGPLPIAITGCTWGGSIVKIDVIAVCGLCIEFGNRVRTSVVRSIAVVPRELSN